MSSWALHGSSLRHSVRQRVVPKELFAYQPQSAIFFLHRRPADASQALVRRPSRLSKAAFAGADRDRRAASVPHHSTELVGALDLPQGLSNLVVEFPFLDGLRPKPSTATFELFGKYGPQESICRLALTRSAGLCG